MENTGGQPLSPDELDDEVQKLGKAWEIPGYSSEKEPPKKASKEETKGKKNVIDFPILEQDGVSKVFKEKTSKIHVRGFRGKTKMINKVDKEDKRTITFELDKVQKRRMKMEGKYDFLTRAKELNIVPSTERFPFHASGAPDAEKLNPLLSLFFTEAWWKMTAAEKKEFGFKSETGLTNGLIKRYIVARMHESDQEKFKGIRFNITTNMDALMKKLHENQCRKKKPISGLLEMDKSSGFVKLKPEKSLKSLGYNNFLKLLESTKEKGLNQKDVMNLMTEAAGGTKTPGSSPGKPSGSETDLLNASESLHSSSEDEAAKSALTATQIHGVHIKIIKRPDGTVEMDFQL
jgi:hypothetical protein